VFADLKQNAPGRGRTLLLIYVVIEAMITFFAVPYIIRIGLFSQSLLPGIGGCSLYSNKGPVREAVSLSRTPSDGSVDNGIRAFTCRIRLALTTFRPDCMSPWSSYASLSGEHLPDPYLILNTQNIRRPIMPPADRGGM
jgi:hypothetical protein